MAATFDWQEDTGTATGSPAKGTTRTTGVTNVNWKNSGTQGTAYTAAPITAGNNSYEKWQFGKFTGSFNQVLNGKFAHTSNTGPGGALTTGISLYGPPAASSSMLSYTTPSATTNTNLTTDMTSAISIASGVAVYFGPTGPEATSTMVASYSRSASEDVYTNYLTTQLRTTSSAAAGDTPTITLTLQYDEN